MSRTLTVTAIAAAIGLLAATSCSTVETPASPTSLSAVPAAAGQTQMASDHTIHVNGKPEDKGYIDGWFDGADVNLYYTKAYYCAEPPASGAPSECEIGAPAETPPRPGPIPTIYALAAVGFTPDPSTVACLRGSPCLDHPAMIDLSRIGGPASAVPLSHSHVLDAHHAGWFNTVNIRVLSLAAWNEIAAAKTLAKVRELQGDPHTGRPGVISADTPTNIYFFIASWREDRN
jgi:hypothetical protein